MTLLLGVSGQIHTQMVDLLQDKLEKKTHYVQLDSLLTQLHQQALAV
jgi:hypothetical protein